MDKRTEEMDKSRKKLKRERKIGKGGYDKEKGYHFQISHMYPRNSDLINLTLQENTLENYKFSL